jgi:drug/metabolite transporter (DMT)-like permease
MSGAVAAVVYGILSAFTWGIGDFTGGLASRRSSVLGVIIISNAVGGVLMIIAAVASGQATGSWRDIGMGVAAGLVGTIGLYALYTGISRGQTGVVSPVSAVISSGLPVMIGIFLEGVPGGLTVTGLLLAIAAVWLSSRTGHTATGDRSALRLALIAGLGFGGFFIFFDQVSNGIVFWPMASSRFAASALLLLIALALREKRFPGRTDLPILLFAAVFDVGGNVFFALATQSGRLDIASILSSLFVVVTVILARLILKEQMSRAQWAGVACAVVAVMLIAA